MNAIGVKGFEKIEFLGSKYFPLDSVDGFIVGNAFEYWYTCFSMCIDKLFPDSRALGIIKKSKVLRPTIQEKYIHCEKMLNRMFPDVFSVPVEQILELVQPVMVCCVPNPI